MTSSILAISPLDGRYENKLANLRPLISEYGLIRLRVLVEIRWLQTLAEINLSEFPALSQNAHNTLNKIIENFSEQDALRIKEIENKINHDVKAVEYFIKEQVEKIPELAMILEFIHFGCTSEDINNLAYGLMLKQVREQVVVPELTQLLASLKNIAHENADLPMLARTHGQPASPTTLGKEFANVAARLERQVNQLTHTALLGKLNGATGNYNAFAVAYPDQDWQTISKQFVESLGLTWNPYTTQIEPHDYMSEYFFIMTRINTILLDFARDIWSYISIEYLKLKSLSHEVGSSAMPHKVNPIDFENAEGNLGLANAIFEHMALKLPISRWQRDLSDSTVLRNIGVAFGYSSIAYQAISKGLSKIAPNAETIENDLNDHNEVLAEAIQTVLRRHGIEQPYEKLKAFTRGQLITKPMLHDFIQQLALPASVKEQLLALTPGNYLGYASSLAKAI